MELSTNETTLERVRVLINYGFNLIALEPRGKKPHPGLYANGGIKRVFSEGMTEESVFEIFERYPEANIGILTNNLTVIDADCPEAIEFIEANLTPTPLVVSTGKGRHYYYGPSDVSRVTKPLPSGGEAFSIRGPRSINYVVAPGSIHPSGEFYAWVRFGDIGIDELPTLTRFDISALSSAIDRAFSPGSSLGDLNINLDTLGKFFEVPTKTGSRNNALASLVGQWFNDGHTSLDVLLERANAWNDTNPEPLDEDELTKTVTSIQAKAAKNAQPVILSPNTPPVESLNLRKEPKIERKFKIRPPGILGDVFDYALRSAPNPNEVVATQAALALGSIVLGRRYVSEANNYTSLYFLTVAKSTTGKEHGKTVIEAILEAAEIESLRGGAGYTSPGAVFSILKDKPAHITIIDEFGAYLEAARAMGNSALSEAVTTLMEAFGRLHGSIYPRSYSTMTEKNDANDTIIKRPAITLLGMTTPGRLYKSLHSGDVEGGLLGRLLVVESNAPRQMPRYVRPIDPPTTIIDWCKKARSVEVVGDLVDVLSPDDFPIEVPIDDAARNVFDDFGRHLIKRQDALESIGLDVILGRTREIAMRVATILAVSVDVSKPVITDELAEWAVDYVRVAFERLVNTVKRNMAENRYDADRKRILDAIASEGERGLTHRELARALAGIPPRTRNEVLSDLTESGLISIVDRKTTSKGGRPARAIVAIEPEDD